MVIELTSNDDRDPHGNPHSMASVQCRLDDPFVESLRVLSDRGYALACQMLHHQDDAADAVQDSLRSAWAKRSRFDPGRGEITGWFLKIVRNRCLDMLRSRKRKSTTQIVLDGAVTDPKTSLPAETLEHQESMTLIKEELMNMPDEQREIILMRDFHGLSYAEVSEVLAIPPGTVMSRLHRARNELRLRINKRYKSK